MLNYINISVAPSIVCWQSCLLMNRIFPDLNPIFAHFKTYLVVFKSKCVEMFYYSSQDNGKSMGLIASLKRTLLTAPSHIALILHWRAPMYSLIELVVS